MEKSSDVVSPIQRLAAVLACFLAYCGPARAQTPDPTPLRPLSPAERPFLTAVPRFQDWQFLRNPAAHTDIFDPLKYIPLTKNKESYLTLGYESRSEFQYLENSDWGAGPQDSSGYMLQRFMPDADLRLGHSARAFVTLNINDVAHKRAGPNPGVDKDLADVHEAFVELGHNLHAEHPGVDVVLGRQEFVLGTGRLFDDNEGVNVRNSFDGVRLGYDKPFGRLDLFALRPVLNNFGVWDDVPDHSTSVWGAYFSGGLLRRDTRCDIYYVGLDKKSMTYGENYGREIRHTFGLRFFDRSPDEAPRAGFDFNEEIVTQWGAFANKAIRAWGVGSEIGWTTSEAPWNLRIAMRADAISGDNGNIHQLGTFNALFPRGAFFGPKFALVGPANLLDLQPMLVFHPFRNVTGTAEWIWFWRESTSDALYSFQNIALRTGNQSRARFVGSQPNLEIRWVLDQHTTAAFNLAGAYAGAFLRDTPPAKTVTFANVGLTYRF